MGTTRLNYNNKIHVCISIDKEQLEHGKQLARWKGTNLSALLGVFIQEKWADRKELCRE
jgi:hypothetical protein